MDKDVDLRTFLGSSSFSDSREMSGDCSVAAPLDMSFDGIHPNERPEDEMGIETKA